MIIKGLLADKIRANEKGLISVRCIELYTSYKTSNKTSDKLLNYQDRSSYCLKYLSVYVCATRWFVLISLVYI